MQIQKMWSLLFRNVLPVPRSTSQKPLGFAAVLLAVAVMSLGCAIPSQSLPTLKSLSLPFGGNQSDGKMGEGINAGDSDSLASASSTADPQSSPKATLREALSEGLVEGEVRGRGLTSGNSIVVTLQKMTPGDLYLEVTRGTILLNHRLEGPDMVVSRIDGLLTLGGRVEPVKNVHLADDIWHEYVLTAFSLEGHEGAPRPSDAFTVGEAPISEVFLILEAADKLEDVSPEDIQTAIWVLTDGADLDQLIEWGYTPHVELLRTLFGEAGLDLKRKRIFAEAGFQTAQGYASRGNSYFAQGEYAQALADYTEAITMEPDFPETLYRRGLAHVRLKHFPKAIDDFTEVISLEPQNALGYFGLGMIHSSTPEPNYDQAIKYYGQAIQQNPEFGDAYYGRGLAYAASEDFDLAIKDFTKTIELDSTFVDAYYARGTARGSRQEFDRAIEDFTAAIDLNPAFAEALRSRGLGYLALGDKPDAIDDFQKYLVLRPQASDHLDVQKILTTLRGEVPVPQAGEVVALGQALELGWVKIEIHGLGVASGDSILLKIQRTGDDDLSITVPTGTVLSSSALGEMDMVVRRLRGKALGEMEFQPAELIRLTNNDPREYIIEAYSLQFDKADPKSTTYFFLGQPNVPQALQVLRAVDAVPRIAGDLVSIQTALWVITDDIDDDELKEIEATPDLASVRAVLQMAGVDLECTRLFGSAPC